MDHKIFAGLDPYVVVYAAAMALMISVLETWRNRNAQRAMGLPLSSWKSAIPETLIGMLIGTFLGVFVAPHVPILNNLAGVTGMCGAGGILGPKLWALFSNRGLNAALSMVPGPVLGTFAKALAAQNKEVVPDDKKQDAGKPPL